MDKKFSGSNIALAGIAALLLVILTLVSCEKEVDIKLDSGEPKLVIEGGIENGLPPFILITKSIGYFDKLDLQTLQNTSVHGAEVYVSDGVKTVRLKEYTVDTGFNNRFYYYSLVDIANPVLPPADSLILGELEKFYTLVVKYEGKEYRSVTKIPTPTPLDSIATTVPNRPNPNQNSRILHVYFKDPDTAGNYLRYYTSRNNEPMYAALNSVFTDEIINGTKFDTELPLGAPRSTTQSFDSLGLCYPGDSVTIKWTAIEKAVYEFWNTYEYSLGTLGSPFATPIQVKSNISNGALGVWAGYGTLYYSIEAE